MVTKDWRDLFQANKCNSKIIGISDWHFYFNIGFKSTVVIDCIWNLVALWYIEQELDIALLGIVVHAELGKMQQSKVKNLIAADKNVQKITYLKQTLASGNDSWK